MIQSLWIGDQLSVMEQLSISSFLQNGHSYHIYAYDEIQGLPHGTELKDANSIISSESIFRNKHYDTYAGFADMFRYKLLYERGGYWVDSDVICLKPFQFETDYLFVADRYKKRPLDWVRNRYHVNTWVIKAPRGSEIMEYCYRKATKYDIEKLIWGEIGPKLLTHAVGKLGLSQYIVPWGTFFPIDAWQWKHFINNSLVASWKWLTARQHSYAVHLYNEMWRRNSADKNAGFHRNSIYERLKRIYSLQSN